MDKQSREGVRFDIYFDAALLARAGEFASALGVTLDEVLVEAVESMMARIPLPETKAPGDARDDNGQ